MKQKNFLLQTHFIGVLLPLNLTQKMEEYRSYMRQAYACKSGQKTPVHITLIPPFSFTEETLNNDCISCKNIPQMTNILHKAILSHFSEKKLSFTTQINGFGSFQERTLFAYIPESDKWNNLKKEAISSVSQFLPKKIITEKKPFQPHISIANRDIPTGTIPDILNFLNEQNLKTEFTVNNITIFEKNGYNWISAKSIEL